MPTSLTIIIWTSPICRDWEESDGLVVLVNFKINHVEFDGNPELPRRGSIRSIVDRTARSHQRQHLHSKAGSKDEEDSAAPMLGAQATGYSVGAIDLALQARTAQEPTRLEKSKLSAGQSESGPRAPCRCVDDTRLEHCRAAKRSVVRRHRIVVASPEEHCCISEPETVDLSLPDNLLAWFSRNSGETGVLYSNSELDRCCSIECHGIGPS